MGVALEIPDPRNQPVPPGWFENTAAPTILATTDWAVLDEYEGRLRAFASYIDSFNGDAVEFEKALRVVDKRRADLLGARRPGARTDLEPLTRVLEVGASPMTVSRWRTLGRNWDRVWPVIVEATDRRAVTQAALLRLIERDEDSAPKEEPKKSCRCCGRPFDAA